MKPSERCPKCQATEAEMFDADGKHTGWIDLTNPTEVGCRLACGRCGEVFIFTETNLQVSE